MKTAPDLLHGTWQRRAASVSGSEPFETQHVVWVQAGTCYADLRVPFSGGAETRCFTGRSGWEGTDSDRYRWQRHLDLSPVPGDDVGELGWEDDALVERGMFPTPDGDVAYEEVWVRLAGSEGPFLALEAADACLVRTGDHAITVVGTGPALAAVYRVLRDGEWVDVLSVGRAASSLPGPSCLPSWPVIHRGSA